ncbi:MAG: RIP metalloprotease RseP [Bacillota bacterium]
MGILIAIFIFVILIVSHELGHYLLAKANGIYVYEFSLGLGPKVFGFKRKETEYTLRALPIGGACMMMGEDEDSADPRAFNRKKVWQRMLVVAGGPLMNFVAAIIIFIIVFMMMGMPSSSNIVGSTVPGQAAQVAGMKENDAIVEINGQKTETWNDIVTVIQEQPPGEVLNVVVLRDGQHLPLKIKPYHDEASDRWMVGISPLMETRGLGESIALGFRQSYELTKLLLLTLIKMVSGQMPLDVAGPVGVVTIVGQAASTGWQNLLILTGFLSINLGVINLLPIPALDGSRLVFLAVEGIRRKPIKREREGMIHFIGFALLIGLMVIITYRDVLRLIEGG